jgi:ring-1,2-phenylacetyl-CoA epoxidase subunit PaaD
MASATLPTREEIFAILGAVPDPEVPVLSVVDLGIIRDAIVDERGVEVVITPTYSGCPAMQVIERDVIAALTRAGLPNPRVRTTFTPAWTTDWISAEAREKMRAYGIAPPGPRDLDADPLVQILTRSALPSVACPYCGSRDTVLRSEFGPTACKSIRSCNACQQPFEQFKAI